ncbi:hypothetical protein NZK32_13570 [Cyanobium sp. FGCU-52]|nr:hypothetical protein [Cyanobium sp. FGCU52]
MLQVEKDNCQGTTEVSYRSQKLISPDEKITLYFEGVLRRVGQKGDVGGGGENYCYPLRGRQTLSTTLVIETPTPIRIALISGKGSYAVINLISFSGDNRHLLLRVHYGFDGGDGDTTFGVINLQSKYQTLPLKTCRNSYGSSGRYKGFVSSSEILVVCGDGSFEVANLEKESVQQVSGSFASNANVAKGYGTLLEQTTILKRQIFPPRK